VTAQKVSILPLAVHQNDVLEVWTQRRQLREEGRQAGSNREGAVLCFVDHGGEMSGGNSRIQRVADEPRAHERVVHLQMMLGVPAESADPIAETQAQCSERPRQAVASRS
jgi:hypothetical protein